MGAFCSCGAWHGTLGNEPSPDLYVAHLLEVFREVWRVLRDDGTVWANLGDSFASTSSYNAPRSSGGKYGRVEAPRQPNAGIPLGLKPKDLMGIPWTVALALRADGWHLRRDIIWEKPAPMPESVTDRCTTSHEYIFMLTKRADYFYDHEAVKEPDSGQDHPRAILGGQASLEPSGGLMSPHRGIRTPGGRNGTGRNRRSVWRIASKPFVGLHFATFPLELPEICIRAGTSERGCCRFCGAPWRPIFTRGLANARVQCLLPDQAGNDVRYGPPEAGWAETNMPTVRQGATESTQDTESRQRESSRQEVPPNPPGGDSEEEASISNHGPGQDPDAGGQPALFSYESSRPPLQATESGEVPPDSSRPLDGPYSLRSSTSQVVELRNRANDDRVAGDHRATRVSLPVLPRAVHSRPGTDDGPHDPFEPWRSAQSGQHRGSMPQMQFKERDQDAQRVLWRPTCRCRNQRGQTVPAIVCDPFGGAGTTGLAAARLGRDAILAEANPEYAAMSERRIHQDNPLFNKVIVD